MLTLREEMNALRRELEAERVENAKYRRMMEDLLYNLDEDNMPGVAARLTKGEKSIGLLVEDGQVRGRILVEAINGQSGVTLQADKIDLNGAVSANGNFKILLDGSAICRALTITGGSISLPDPQDGSAVLRVHTEDGAGGVTVYADRVAFEGTVEEGWEQRVTLNLEELSLHDERTYADGSKTKSHAYYRPSELILRHEPTDLEPYEARLCASYLYLPALLNSLPEEPGNMYPLYVDQYGYLHAAKK